MNTTNLILSLIFLMASVVSFVVAIDTASSALLLLIEYLRSDRRRYASDVRRTLLVTVSFSFICFVLTGVFIAQVINLRLGGS